MTGEIALLNTAVGSISLLPTLALLILFLIVGYYGLESNAN